MNGELCVKVVYRDKEMKPTYTKIYTLDEYTEMLRTDLLKLITDIENLCYAANNNKQKEDWTDDTFSAFCLIKHKLLDKAGDIGRIPENIVVKEPMNQFIAGLLEGSEAYGKGRLGQD